MKTLALERLSAARFREDLALLHEFAVWLTEDGKDPWSPTGFSLPDGWDSKRDNILRQFLAKREKK